MKLALTCFVGLLTAGILGAQEVPRFSATIGGGFTEPLGNTGRNLDTGWNIQGGVGVNINAYLGIQVQGQFNDFGINGSTLTNLGYPGGDVHIFSATVDPVIHLNPKGHVDFYLIGGGGLYHTYQEFTQPSVETFTGYNPFFGFYNFGVPSSQVLSSYSVNKPGWNAGVGVAFGTKVHGKFFAESRYTHVYMTRSHIDYLPVTFGYRW